MWLLFSFLIAVVWSCGILWVCNWWAKQPLD